MSAPLIELLSKHGIQTDIDALNNMLYAIDAADPSWPTSTDYDASWLSLIGDIDPKSDAGLALIAHKNSLPNRATNFENTHAHVAAIRKHLDAMGLDGVIIFRGDEFNNEYVPNCNERLAFATGFTGSAGCAVIMRDSAAVFSDTRYTIQLRAQAPSDIFSYEDYKKDALKNWLDATIEAGQKIAVNARVITVDTHRPLEKVLSDKKAELVLCDGNDPVDAAWDEIGRPPAPLSPIIALDESYSGQSTQNKIKDIIATLKNENANSLILNDLPSIAWLLNLRARDVACTPVFLSYLKLDKDGSGTLFVEAAKMAPAIKNYLDENNITIKPIDNFFDDLKTINNQKVWLDGASMAVLAKDILSDGQNTFHMAPNPCILPKAIKTEAEQQGAIKAHEIDGVAVTKFLYWMAHEGQSGEITEMDAEAKLEECRRLNPAYKGPSFETIAGAVGNGAIVHYRVTPKTNTVLAKDSLFLCDSGGQYLSGTTDITRTIAIGTPSAEMKDRFTRVLKGHIAVSRAVLTKHTTGVEVDALARAPLKEVGLNYGHGTGHGVGSYLSVHEGPQGIGSYWTRPYETGMIVSNEPGFYKEGEYGIRIENLEMVQEGKKGQKYFKSLTLAPLDVNCMDLSLLDKAEIEWINDYHARVYEAIAPQLEPHEKQWLYDVTRPLAAQKKKFLGIF